METKKNIEFAVKGLIISNGRFLAVHRSSNTTGELELPGGRMEFGETAEETLAREVKEELGFSARPLKLIDTWNYIVSGTWQITGIIYLCQCDNVSEITLSDEHDGYEWLGFNRESISRMAGPFREKMEKWDWEDYVKL